MITNHIAMFLEMCHIIKLKGGATEPTHQVKPCQGADPVLLYTIQIISNTAQRHPMRTPSQNAAKPDTSSQNRR